MDKPVLETCARLYQQVTDRGPWSQTVGGTAFFLGDPQPSEVHITDIGHSLSRQGRYNGHTNKFYSIAQHAWLVSRWMEEDGHGPDLAYAGLHHDSAEAYTGDIVSQLKFLVPAFRRLEDKVEDAVFYALDVNMSPRNKRIVKDYDMLALSTERRDLLARNRTEFSWGDLPEPRGGMVITPWTPEVAEYYFMERHAELKRRIS